MLSLMLMVFLLNFLIHIINTIGATTIDTILWLFFLRLPLSAGRTATEQQRLKKEVLQLKREMNGTSSQDEFAKWAKLRRRHDKTLEIYNSKNRELTDIKTAFDTTIQTLRWLSTTGLRLFAQFWFAKTPMFSLPSGWLPWQAEWVLSFPRAPMGTVSIQIWGGACAAVIELVVGTVTSVFLKRGASVKLGDKERVKETEKKVQ